MPPANQIPGHPSRLPLDLLLQIGPISPSISGSRQDNQNKFERELFEQRAQQALNSYINIIEQQQKIDFSDTQTTRKVNNSSLMTERRTLKVKEIAIQLE